MIDKKYATHNREPFFELAKKYIQPSSKVLDIGSGNGSFSKFCNRDDFYLFDGNENTVEVLKSKYENVFLGQLPMLPFENGFFDVIHCSHVVEHLEPEMFYQTLMEMDRCLKEGGILIISAPLYWSGFYNDLSHVRPYNPKVYLNYLCSQQINSRTRPIISTNYIKKELVYRYLESDSLFIYTNSKNSFIVNVLIKILNRLRKIGFGMYERTGYTIVLLKSRK